jgi:hypothetical protein
MNDIEVQVIDKVIRAVKAEYPNAKVEDRFTENPASFPYVCVYETNSFMPQRYQDNTRKELYTEVAYEAQVFTNDTMKKSTAKAIAEIVDTTMQDIGFLRTFKSQVPNIDRTIYRIVLRYTAVVENATYGDTNNVINIYHR